LAVASQTTRTAPGAPHGGELHARPSPTFSLALSRVRALVGDDRRPAAKPTRRGLSSARPACAQYPPRRARRVHALGTASRAPQHRTASSPRGRPWRRRGQAPPLTARSPDPAPVHHGPVDHAPRPGPPWTANPEPPRGQPGRPPALPWRFCKNTPALVLNQPAVRCFSKIIRNRSCF